MIKSISVTEGSVADKILFCKELFLNELPDIHIVPLFGPNGIGKSTLLNGLLNSGGFKRCNRHIDGIKPEIKGKTTVLGYLNGQDNFRVRQASNYAEAFDPFFMSNRYNAGQVSEGQSILFSAIDLFDMIGTSKNAVRYEDKDILVVLDEFDSGLSVDNLDRILRKLRNTQKKRPDVQVIFSFNNPYVLRYFPDVISLYTGHVIHLETVDDMMAEIKKHEKEFRKVRYYSNGKPKVY